MDAWGQLNCLVMSQISYATEAHQSRAWCCHNGQRPHTSIISQDNHLKTTPPSWSDLGNSSIQAHSSQETVGCIKLMIKNQPAEQDSHLILKQSLSLLVPFCLSGSKTFPRRKMADASPCHPKIKIKIRQPFYKKDRPERPTMQNAPSQQQRL